MKSTSSLLPYEIQTYYKNHNDLENIEGVECHYPLGLNFHYIVKFFNSAKDKWFLENKNWKLEIIHYPEDGNAD